MQNLILAIDILDGRRQGTTFTLPVKEKRSEIIHRIYEDESLRIKLSLPLHWGEVQVAIADQVLPPTLWNIGDSATEYIWEPERYNNKYTPYFRNYFGMAAFELFVLNTKTGLEEIFIFSEIEVLAKKLNAERASQMLDYLFKKTFPLHAVSSATKQKGSGYDGRGETPSQKLDTLEHICGELEKNLPIIVRRPLTRLRQHRVIKSVKGNTLEASEVSIQWLAQNTDQIIPEPDAENAHLYLEGQSYRISRLAVQQSMRTTDIPENRRILGVLRLLQQQTVDIISGIQNRVNSVAKRSVTGEENHGYISFFNSMAHHIWHLNKERIDRCERLKVRLNACSKFFETSIPVKQPELSLTISAKSQSHHAYRDIMLSALKLYGSVNWENEDLFLSIHSIPMLYELFCLEQLKETMLKIQDIREVNNVNLVRGANSGKHGFYSWQEWNISLFYQPIFKSPKGGKDNIVVNSEGWLKKSNGSLIERIRNKRIPDFVIDIQHRFSTCRYLVVLDAKYTHGELAFNRDLPSLVMKYIHGLHLLSGGYSPVVGLFILFPEKKTRSYHHDHFRLNGNTIALPVLTTYSMSPTPETMPYKLNDQLFKLFSEVTKQHSSTYKKKQQINIEHLDLIECTA